MRASKNDVVGNNTAHQVINRSLQLGSNTAREFEIYIESALHTEECKRVAPELAPEYF
jgi:hypothetical protein